MTDFDSTLQPLLDRVGTGLKEIQQAFAAHQETNFKERPREFFSLELCGEAGELANLEKKRWKGNEIEIGRFNEEAADVFIALCNYCNSAGVDLADAVMQKVGLIPPTKNV